jgi:hypothetical protein
MCSPVSSAADDGRRPPLVFHIIAAANLQIRPALSRFRADLEIHLGEKGVVPHGSVLRFRPAGFPNPAGIFHRL